MGALVETRIPNIENQRGFFFFFSEEIFFKKFWIFGNNSDFSFFVVEINGFFFTIFLKPFGFFGYFYDFF